MSILMEQILDITVLAGEIMLRNGAETSRVEETMFHMARALGAVKAECFVIPTGVFLTVTCPDGRTRTIMRRVHDRTINLDRIAKVNELSRRLADKRIDYEMVCRHLERIARERTGFSLFAFHACFRSGWRRFGHSFERGCLRKHGGLYFGSGCEVYRPCCFPAAWCKVYF